MFATYYGEYPTHWDLCSCYQCHDQCWYKYQCQPWRSSLQVDGAEASLAHGAAAIPVEKQREATADRSQTLKEDIPVQVDRQEDDKQRIQDMTKELEDTTLTKLKKLQNIAVAEERDTDMLQCIARAFFFFENDATPSAAVDTLKQIELALRIMIPSGHLYDELRAAARYTRDTLITRVQELALPIGDEKKYKSILAAAYANYSDTLDDDEEMSRLMQSYKKAIWEKFDNAFDSNRLQQSTHMRNWGCPRSTALPRTQTVPRQSPRQPLSLPQPGLEDRILGPLPGLGDHIPVQVPVPVLGPPPGLEDCRFGPPPVSGPLHCSFCPSHFSFCPWPGLEAHCSFCPLPGFEDCASNR